MRAIEAALAMNGHTRAELAASIGQSRAIEVLGRRRALTLPTIRKIAGAWRVPERVLRGNMRRRRDRAVACWETCRWSARAKPTLYVGRCAPADLGRVRL